MKHEELTERAALYAIGQIDEPGAAAFEEHLREGCEQCEADLRSLRETAARLAFDAPPTAPAAALRERVLAITRPPAPPGLHVVRSSEGEWEPGGQEGMSVKRLFVDQEHGMVTMLVRMGPGGVYPPHRHAAHEQCLVLEGDLRFGDLVLKAGDYQCALHGSTHSMASTVKGCLLLLVASLHDQVVA
ncbi:MAG: cupin domain-containing protein [Acidobacteria bacterium]|nr:cupin domain-containing protein [Acidobacteriota bacterium]